MMEVRSRLIKRIALGVAMLILASGMTLVIKDLLAVRSPENSIPQMTVHYNGTQMPEMHVLRASWSWRFLTGPVEKGVEIGELYETPFAPVIPDAPLELYFSYAPRDVVISVAEGKGPFVEDDFTVIAERTGEPVPPHRGEYIFYNNECTFTPQIAGDYVYRIWVDWGFRGSVLYYVKLEVRA